MEEPNLIRKLRERLPVPARSLFDRLISLADCRVLSVYLVGGPTRDLLIDQSSVDLDIAVEGDAMALARELAQKVGGRVVTHTRFGTATVRISGFHLDLIAARTETYARPGALPTVKPATIENDLLRRDFTINALALRLSGGQAGEVLDPSGGRADLKARLVRVLHERSFQDDATRILRAFRYATRLGFEIEPQTLDWLRRDLHFLEMISGARLHHEFARILEEREPERVLVRLHDLRVLAAIHPVLRFERAQAIAFGRLREVTATGARASYWPVLAWGLSEPEDLQLAHRLAATKPQREAMAAMPALKRLESDLARRSVKRSAVAKMLEPFPLPAIWALAALTDGSAVRQRVLDYLTKSRNERPRLTGDDLIALGVPEGPPLGEILRRLRNNRLDGEVTSRQDEERLVHRLVAERNNAHHHPEKAAASRSS